MPPYKPTSSLAGMPSICNCSTSPEKLPLALPKINNPPHKPLDSGDVFSKILVKIIGSLAVPTAFILAPLVIIKQLELAPVPPLP